MMTGEQILDLNAFDPGAGEDLGVVLDAQVRQRARLFGAASVLFYQKPLEFLRGAGCWLYDADGVAYLDAYNNVPSVGHCHPRVVAAAARQLAELNIHNRYLHPGITGYAERLLGTFPAGFANVANVTFTCTGSESNDLALRLAANFTGARGVIVTESAYHGNTALVTDVSPTLVNHAAAPPWVRFVPAPVSAESFAGHVAAAIADLKASGVGFSALLLDSIFSSDGVWADPPGFLRAAVATVHAAKGLYIADEVQSGFGRTGSWWGFERHGVAPDVVTLGKPMGNGYPVGAVVARGELLDAYCARFGYFNTFAGSPVAAAVGSAVLDVIEDEGLMDNAREVGAYLMRGLGELAARHPAIGQVRGAGLYVGVDLVREGGRTKGAIGANGGANSSRAERRAGAGVDEGANAPGAEAKGGSSANQGVNAPGAAEGGFAVNAGEHVSGAGAPATELARAVINGLRNRRVLIGASGKCGNTLKIRPPLCFSRANADHLVAAVDEVLTHAAADP